MSFPSRDDLIDFVYNEARMIDDGEVALGGRIPVNVSGGLLSKGHPLGATGIANIYEVSTHLRGEAGQRQVEGARIGLTHVIGKMRGRDLFSYINLTQGERSDVATLAAEVL